MITDKNKWKVYQKIYYVNVNVNLMEENVIEIKSGITVDVDANVKNIYM